MVYAHNYLMFSTAIIRQCMTGLRAYTFTSDYGLRTISIKVGIENFIDINYIRPSSDIMSMITHIFRSLDTKLSGHLVRIILTGELYYLFPTLKIFRRTN